MDQQKRNIQQTRIFKCVNDKGQLVITNQPYIKANIKSFLVDQNPPSYSMAMTINNHRETWSLDRKDMDALQRICKNR